jgi:glyoxylase-like metal-dependent hydrolase (beta-lactamase superfamily II)
MPLASFGHTAGHTFYAVRSKGQKILFWGDIVLSDLVQFAHPSVTSLYDFDEKVGVSVRERALADAEKSGYYVAVSHIDFPGIGHIIKNVNGYQFIPLK